MDDETEADHFLSRPVKHDFTADQFPETEELFPEEEVKDALDNLFG